MPAAKSSRGTFFEDFSIGQVIRHATPRTITAGDVAVYQSLYGARFAVQSSTAFAREIGYAEAPVDDLIVYNVVFGRTVPETAMNSIAALGLADCRFLRPVYPGDTLSATSEVIGLRPTVSGEAGIVYIRSIGRNQRGEVVLEYTRWTLVRRRQQVPAETQAAHVPRVPEFVPPNQLGSAVPPLNSYTYDRSLAGSPYIWNDYEPGERIDHIDGMTLEEASQQAAVALYQVPSRIHLNLHTESQGRFGKRIAYGGAVLSLTRALTFNGLTNAFHISAINSVRHLAPVFALDTIYAWSEVQERAEIPGRRDIGGLRVKTYAAKNRDCTDFPLPPSENPSIGAIAIELDYWVVLPR